MQKEAIVIDDERIDIYENKLRDFHFTDGDVWAIYGTGDGAEIVYQIFKRWKLEKNIGAIVDNDAAVERGVCFHDTRAVNLCSVCARIDGIIIASMNYHEVVYERVQTFIDKYHKERKIQVVNLFGHNTDNEVREYVNYIENYENRRDEKLYRDYDASPVELGGVTQK